MFTRILRQLAALCLFGALPASAAVLYVDLNSANPVPPFSSWATAATNIQDAVDAASSGDQVLVTNGIYQSGGRTVPPNLLTNRLVVTNAITVESVNGPSATVIQGFQVPGNLGYGTSAIRCAYLDRGAEVIGFTLTNGATLQSTYLDSADSGGGAFSPHTNATLYNCVVTGNLATEQGAGVCNLTLINCALVRNVCSNGTGSAIAGAAAYSILTNCLIAQNTAQGGGAVAYSSLNNCTISNNNTYGVGGGAYIAILNNCTLVGNVALICGGAAQSTLNSCTLVSNIGINDYGGAYQCTLINCLLSGNSVLAPFPGDAGGVAASDLYNCTVVGNTASSSGGGVFDCTLYNCIVVSNNAPAAANYVLSPTNLLNFCCTTPLPPTGSGNITNDPLFVNAAAGNFHLQAGSPCINAGNNAYVSAATDFAGNPRISGGIVDMGAYELQFHYVDQTSANPVSPFSSWAIAATNIQDAVDAATNYDEVLVANGLFQTGGRPAPGQALTNRLVVTNAISVQSVNGPAVTVIKGFQVPGSTNGPSAVRCVYLAGGAQLIGFTLTNGAALNSVATNHDPFGGGVLCASTNEVVSNCLITGNCAYSGGGGAFMGTLNDCTLAGNSVVPLILYSFGIPIEQNGSGGGAAASILNGCSLIGNSAASGGGASGGILNNCVLTGNTAITPSFIGSPHGSGGGAAIATLSGCVLSGNYSFIGGGAYLVGNTLHNCTVVSNSAYFSGGGIYNGYQFAGGPYNCIVYDNSAPTYSNYYNTTLTSCCTTPLPTNSLGNITNDPLFVNAVAGNFHLQSGSPCVNAGNNAYVTTLTDLDGNPRISGGTVDIGAYEFQNPASIISYAWLDQYGLPTDGSADFLDSDHNGMNNWQKWIAGLDPTNPSSILQMLAPTPSGTNLVVTWQSVTNITYYLQRATDISAVPAFQPLATNLPGQAVTTSFTDTNAPAPGPYFYRVGVQQP